MKNLKSIKITSEQSNYDEIIIINVANDRNSSINEIKCTVIYRILRKEIDYGLHDTSAYNKVSAQNLLYTLYNKLTNQQSKSIHTVEEVRQKVFVEGTLEDDITLHPLYLEHLQEVVVVHAKTKT